MLSKKGKPTHILGIESSCDDTAAAVCVDGRIVSDIVGRQSEHAVHGGVVPELASRLHLELIGPVVRDAIQQAGIELKELNAVAVTQGPGLVGALLVGDSFAKGMCTSLQIPLISVDHMVGHLHSVFIAEKKPAFPFLCLTVSGGHTQISLVRDYLQFEIIGKTRDDAAGEAFDKMAKLMGLPYPGGPEVDRLAETGNPDFIKLPFSHIKGYEFSFSGLKTAFLYHLQDALQTEPDYIKKNQADLCASVRYRIVHTLLDKLFAAADEFKIQHLALVGGVSANRLLRREFELRCQQCGRAGFVPPFRYCTDNAAMIAMAGHHLFRAHRFAPLYSTVFSSQRTQAE